MPCGLRLPAGAAGWLWGYAALFGALLFGLSTWWWPVLAHAQSLQPVPPLTARVMDLTGTLTPEQRAALEARLATFERERGSQVVVLLVNTTAPEDIADYTQRVGDAWKIGRRDVGDGVLFVVAMADRRVRIATTKAVEGAIPDVLASRIIERAIVPRFREGDIYGGLHAGIEQILAALAHEELPPPGATQRAAHAPDAQGALLFAFFAVPVIASVLRGVLGRVLGAIVTAGVAAVVGMALGLALVWWILLALVAFVLALLGVGVGGAIRASPWGGGHAGWSGGGGFGGGFSSGGGGNFGGGGASGRW